MGAPSFFLSPFPYPPSLPLSSFSLINPASSPPSLHSASSLRLPPTPSPFLFQPFKAASFPLSPPVLPPASYLPTFPISPAIPCPLTLINPGSLPSLAPSLAPLPPHSPLNVCRRQCWRPRQSLLSRWRLLAGEWSSRRASQSSCRWRARWRK